MHMTSLYLLQVDTIARTCQYVRVMHYTVLVQMQACSEERELKILLEERELLC